MRDIISELLAIASAAVSNSDTEMNEVTISTFSADSDESDQYDYDEEGEEWLKMRELIEQFRSLDIDKKLQSLHDERYRLYHLERYMAAIAVEEEIFSLLPEHVTKWNEIVGSDEYLRYNDQNRENAAESLMKAYVALLDNNGIERIRKTVLKLNKLTKFMDQEIFDMEYTRYKEEIKIMRKIYEFIRNNPRFPQKNLYRELSIDGHKTVHMLNWADNLDCIQRIKYRDTWLLSIDNV